MLKTYLVVLTLMSGQAFAQNEYVDELLQNRNPRIMKRLGLDKKVKKKQPAEVVVANNKEVAPQPTEQEKLLAELKVKEEEITTAALKQLTDYMDLKGQDHDIFTDPEYFKLLSEVKKKEKVEIAKLYESVWKPEELDKHNSAFDRDICRGDRNVYLLGKVKPASAVMAIMDKHDAEFDKEDASYPARLKMAQEREKEMREAGVVDEFGDVIGESGKAKTACEILTVADAEKYGKEEVVVVEKKNEGPKVDQRLKNLDVESCTWVPEMPRRKFFGPGCGPSSKKYICAGYVSCKQKNSELRTIRASTCSDENCGDADAVACTKEGGYGSVKPTKEAVVKPVTIPVQQTGSAY
jgi:hypothetical protein